MRIKAFQAETPPLLTPAAPGFSSPDENPGETHRQAERQHPTTAGKKKNKTLISQSEPFSPLSVAAGQQPFQLSALNDLSYFPTPGDNF